MPVLATPKHYTLFHNIFFKSLETASRYPNEDADMRRQHVAVTAALVALTTTLLSACGPDDSTSASVDQGNPAPTAAPTSGHETSPTVTPQSAFGASATLTSAPDTAATAATAASDSAVQSVQASLAADSQQVAPVLHYAPGDSDQNSNSNSN
ncbi:hypothetical protein SAMN05216466_11842 [Paraburkholderia phenazinium]|uniref:Uncharacterized protein n=2 Tax=Paraburkholderia phenazinium TaxID=60549 RepID=A0A1G8ICG0_9BURK|nr:hypothetical protein SAMN05216466_11842 [Paraburkholderia phenazinium]